MAKSGMAEFGWPMRKWLLWIHFELLRPHRSLYGIDVRHFVGMKSSLRRLLRQWRAWRDFTAHVKPVVGFDDTPPPTPPDYADPACWATHPDHPNKSRFTPEGSGLHDGQATARADVFYLHPTSFFGRDAWNASLDDAGANEWVDELMVPAQASVFNGCCRVFAPRYRQATFYAFIERGKNGRRALELAYDDVARAFIYYIEHYNAGRPFFLAGHSQGSLHAIRLLEEHIDGAPLAGRMVAAYVPGFRFPMDKVERLKTLRPCEHATDTNCILAWDTYRDDGKPTRFFDTAEHWYATPDGKGRWERRARKTPLCINPLTWRRDTELAPKTLNLGAVPIAQTLPPGKGWRDMWADEPVGVKATGLAGPLQHEVSAQCRKDGFLYISKPKVPALKIAVLPRGDYHNYDFTLFYMNIRRNVEDRLVAFLEQQATSASGVLRGRNQS